MRFLFFCAFMMLLVAPQPSLAQDRLPFPRAMFHKVEFWKKIYSKYSTSQGVLHDSDDLSIVYKEIQLPPSGSRSIVGSERSEIRQALFSILRKRGQNLSHFEREILSKFPKYASRSRLLQATENIRFQLGQADRFKKGVINSGKYIRAIEKILKEEKVPDFIKYLPHVESSFQENAYSKVGAAGLWQIMPQTGRQFLRVDYAVDQRFDPWVSARAAAKYLKQNYRRLGEWPLALTAYNHGAGGVLKAMQTLGTTDIAEIAFQYSSARFGFASRNFYAQFLAAVQVAQDYRKYFGNIKIEAPIIFDEIQLKRTTYLKDFARDYRFDSAEFRKLNLGLRKPVFDNRRPIPKGTIVRLPRGTQKQELMVASLDKKVVKDALTLEQVMESSNLSAETEKEQEFQKAVQRVADQKIEAAQPPALQTQQSAGSADLSLPSIEASAIEGRYSVRDVVNNRGWIKVEINETITQIAEWLDTSADEIRDWNGLEKRAQVSLGQRLLLDFRRRNLDQFVLARTDYHRQIREDFFSRYKVDSFVDYSLQQGENLWSICFQKFDVPPWLLEEFNPGISLSSLKPGTQLKIPVIKDKFDYGESNIAEASN